uniref:Uncharacterized protein n=1 Tax=Zea mays TaxID=4577 RepID=C4J390_MAIZE|nr:unknown [Zea mays]
MQEQVTRENPPRKSFRNAANICIGVRTPFLIRYLNGATQYSPCSRCRCHCKPRTERRTGRWQRRRTTPPALAWICHTTSTSASASASPGSTPWSAGKLLFFKPPQQTV